MSNKSKITSAYRNVERQALGEADDPHFVVLMMFDALLKSMALFRENAAAKEGRQLKLKSESFARSLTIIYALQTSLDFEKGGVISDNLFKLYEYVKYQVMATSKKEAANLDQAIEVVTEITTTWRAIS